MNIRVRFAPSPTGYLHIGSLRTALFNWLYARHTGGTFLVRVEDTDIERSKSEYVDAIFSALEWMQLESDEPVLIQSSRFPEHQLLIEQLLAQGKAYKDFYTQEEMAALYEAKYGSSEFAKAYTVCRDQDQNQNKPYVVRFKLPFERSKEVCFDDVVRGKVCIEIEQLDDFVIARSDGRPMYNFVVVADDIHQRVTHIIRGEDHISNTPKQILLYEALEHKPPIFAHLPLILGKEGQRLSKRDAATGTQEYRDLGYLPDALLNYLVRLGWSHGDQEIFSREQLIALFDIADVGKKGAMFDQEKLDWMNAQYIRHMDDASIYAMLLAVKPTFANIPFTQEQCTPLINLYKDRTKTLVELADVITSFSEAPALYDEAACTAWVDERTKDIVQDLLKQLDLLDVYTEEKIKQVVTEVAAAYDKKMGAVAQPIRIALTGGISSPSVFALVMILGKQESRARLKRFSDYIEKRS